MVIQIAYLPIRSNSSEKKCEMSRREITCSNPSKKIAYELFGYYFLKLFSVLKNNENMENKKNTIGFFFF